MGKRMMQKSCMALILAAVFWLPAMIGAAEKGTEEGHPEVGPEEMYIACADCHKEATPDVHKQWFDSNHGIAMVKCYQCHGTFETFRLTPTRSDCAVCHEEMLEKCPKDQDCWKCHAPHTFKVKNK